MGTYWGRLLWKFFYFFPGHFDTSGSMITLLVPEIEGGSPERHGGKVEEEGGHSMSLIYKHIFTGSERKTIDVSIISTTQVSLWWRPVQARGGSDRIPSSCKKIV